MLLGRADAMSLPSLSPALRPLVILIVATTVSLSLLCHPLSSQPLTFEPTPLDFHSKKLGNCILAFCCPLREHNTSQFKALKLTARSLLTLPSHNHHFTLFNT